MPTRTRPRNRLMAGLACAATVAAAALGAAVPAGGAGPEVLRLGVLGEPATFNVAIADGAAAKEIWNLQYARLTGRDADELAPTAGLAESWQPSPDGLSYTYTLRADLRWSDGKPLTADDVAYTVNRARKERWAGYDSVAGLSAEATGKRTVVVSSRRPDPALPSIDVPIVPRHVYDTVDAEALADYAGDDGVASGPFAITEWKRGDRVRLDPNPNWWGAAPQIGAVEIVFYDDPQALLRAAGHGDVDFAEGLPSSMIQEAEQTREVSTITAQGSTYRMLAMNGVDGSPALRDVQVRRAISYAIDRDTLVAEVVDGVGTPQADLPASLSPRWTLALDYEDTVRFDPAAARRLLDDAGYADADGDGRREMPDGARLELSLTRPADSGSAEIADLVAGWLDDVGVTIEVTEADEPAWETGAGAVFDLMLQTRTASLDPDAQLAAFACPSDRAGPSATPARWCDAPYDRMYRSQQHETDARRRHEIVDAMLQSLYDEVPAAVLFVEDRVQAYRTDRFKGWLRQPDDVGPVLFSETSPSYLLLEVQPAEGTGKGARLLLAGSLSILLGAAAITGFLLLRRRRPAA